MARPLAASLLILAYLLFCAWTAWRHRQRSLAARLPALADAQAPLLIVYASQTGQAEQLAQHSADALQTAGQAVHCCSLDRLDLPTLLRYPRALFIVSTTGEGDAPDSAHAFLRQAMAARAELAGLHYALLALGDRSYAQFCAFGHQLDDWLRHSGAQALFDTVEVDKLDPAALRHWQYELSALAGGQTMADWRTPDYQRWQLLTRRCMNPAGCAAPTFHLRLQALEDGPSWQAGDIAEIGPRNGPERIGAFLSAAGLAAHPDWQLALADRLLPERADELQALRRLSPAALRDALPRLPHREYSIASIPASGALDLLVRQTRNAAGRLGLGSGWLTEYLPEGAELALRIRPNRSFQLDANEDRPLILIGNGTGLASLRAHLQARAGRGQGRNWLIFGERNAAHDFYFQAELQAWQAAGQLSHLDAVFSRDGGSCRYVQHVLQAERARLLDWIAEGAAVYVCGSAQGMAPAVQAELTAALGEAGMDALLAAGRYRRDVY